MQNTEFLQTKAYNILLDMIRNHELDYDTIYSINKLAKKFNISRTPFRDAVLRLEQERYLDLLPSRGFCLHKITAQDLVETFEIREALESYCLKQLSRHLDSERGQYYLKKLEKKIADQQKIFDTDADPEEFSQKDYEFHRSIIQFVNNASMLSVYRSFMYRIYSFTMKSFQKEGRMASTLEEHRKIIELVKSHDIKALEALLEQHLKTPKDINQELMALNEGNQL